jgi:hypothetical protein
MVENFHAHIKTYCEKPRRNFNKFHPVWTFLQAAELIEIFSTGVGTVQTFFTCGKPLHTTKHNTARFEATT